MNLADHARNYIGTPFQHQGRHPGRGLDCAGVVVCALRALGMSVNDRRSYRRVPPRWLLRDCLEQHGFVRASGEQLDGDVLLFWLRNKRLEIHCGVACDGGLVHVEDGGRVHWAALTGWRHHLSDVLRLEARS